MELYTYQEVSDRLSVPYQKIYYMMESMGFCQQAGEAIKSASGAVTMITDKGLQALSDYIEAEKRMIARRPKTFSQIVVERQKKASAERSQKAFDSLPKQELLQVQTQIANYKNVDTKKADVQLLRKRESELLKMLNMEDD